MRSTLAMTTITDGRSRNFHKVLVQIAVPTTFALNQRGQQHLFCAGEKYVGDPLVHCPQTYLRGRLLYAAVGHKIRIQRKVARVRLGVVCGL